MGKSSRPYLPDQDFLLPPSLREWLPENHPIYFVSDVIDTVDLSAINAVYGRGTTGTTALRSAGDDQAAGLWILRGGVQFAAHRLALVGGYRFPGAGGG